METRHVYRVSPWRRGLLYGIWAVFAVPMTVTGLVAGEEALLVGSAVVTIIALPFFVWALRVARLTLTPDGIELRQAGATLETPWANVEAMHMVRRAEGLILREPMHGRGAKRYATTSQFVVNGAPLYEPLRRQLLAEQRFIPIEPFSYWFVHGDLRQVIERYAPGLVQRGEEAAVELQRRERGLSTRAIAAISAIILLAIAAGVLAATRPDVAPIVTRVVLWLVGPAMALMAAVNARSAVIFLRNRQFGSGLLWTAMAIVQALIALACLGELVA